MAFDDDQILQDYIARLLNVQDTREALLNETDLQATARDLGLSEKDLARANAMAEAHRQRGKNFARHSAWDEAIAEFRQAMVLDPFDVPLLHELAVAHASRYEETNDPADREAAYTYAQRCTQLDPNHAPSFALISALNNTSGSLAKHVRSHILLALAAAILISIGVILVVFTTLQSPTSPTPVAPAAPNAPPETAAASETPPRERQVPLQFTGANLDGLHLDVQRSQFNDYDSSFAYRLHATLLNQQAELHRLQMKIDLLAADGSVLTTKTFDARRDYQPPLRPGDIAPIGELVFEKRTPPNVTSARLSVTHIEQEPAASTYGNAPVVPLIWDIPQPAIDIAITERENRLRPNFSKHLHFLTFALHNNGPRAVERLRLHVTWLTAADEEITSKTMYAVPSSGPVLRDEMTWVIRIIGELPDADAERFDHYAVHVIEAE